MADISEAVTIARPCEAVWATLADFGAISRWAPNVDHSCLITGHSDGIGAVRRIQVGRNTFLEQVVEWVPGHRLGYTLEGLPPVVRSVTNTWSLHESGSLRESGALRSDGSTTVTLTSRINGGPRPPQQMIARGVGRVLAKASQQLLAGLKSHLEEATT